MLLFEYLLCARYSSRHFYTRFSCVSPLSLNEVIFFFFSISVLEMRKQAQRDETPCPSQCRYQVEEHVFEPRSSDFHFRWVFRIQSLRKTVIFSSQAHIWTTESVQSICSFQTKDFDYLKKSIFHTAP